MPFDLSSAQDKPPSKFDLASAQDEPPKPTDAPAPAMFHKGESTTQKNVGVLKGVAEGAATLATGALTSVAGASARLTNKALTATGIRDANTGKETEQTINSLEDMLTYKPKSEEGKFLMDKIAGFLKPVSEVGKAVHGEIAKVTSEDTANTVGDVTTLATSVLGGSGVASKAIKGAESTAAKVQGIIKNLSGGNSLGREEVGKVASAAAKQTTEAAKAKGTAAYQALDKVMPPTTSVKLTESATAAAEHGAGLVLDPKVKAVADKLKSLSSLTVETAKELKTQIADMMGVDKNVNRKLRAMSTAIDKDIGAAAEKISPEAKAAWDNSKAEWSAYKKAEDQINKVLGKNWEGKTDTERYNKMFAAARQDPQKITKFMSQVKDPAIRQQFVASALHHLSDVDGKFNGDKLVKQWAAMNPDARKALFGSIGGGYEANMTKLVGKLEKIARGHHGTIKELSGLGVGAALSTVIPHALPVLGAITGIYEAWKYTPATIEIILTNPKAVRALAAAAETVETSTVVAATETPAIDRYQRKTTQQQKQEVNNQNQ